MTLLARRNEPARTALAGPAGYAGPVAAVLAACLVTAACSSGPARHPRAESRPHPGRLSASGSAHPAPSVVPSTTPAAPASRAPSSRPVRHGPAPSPAPTAAPAPSGPAGPGGGGSGAGGSVGPAPLAQCSSSALRVSVGAAAGAAGSIYYPLDFTNVSGTTCTMYGYPGVSFVSAPGGAELGGAAVRNPAVGPGLVRLAPGAVAHASVQVVVAQNYPPARCKPVTAHWLRVYPPDQYVPLYTGLTAQTCTGTIPGGSTLGIYVVRPGANGP
jgi:hypothetical protein